MERRSEGWHIGRTVTIGELATIVVMICSAFAIWYHQNSRISALEHTEQSNQKVMQDISTTLKKLDNNSDRLNERLQDFPLHRHLKGGTIIYPNRIQFPDDNKPESRLFNPNGGRIK